MEPKFQTSFIPKKTLTAAANPQTRRGGSLNIVVLISLIIALGAIVLSVGAFLYKQLIISGIDRKEATLERARAAFEPALIEELVRLDARLISAKEILNQHVAPSALFAVLETLTLQSVQFQSFNFSRSGKDMISFSMKGVARDFRAIALQADRFGTNNLIRQPIFSDLNLDQAGNAVFSFSALIDPALVSYVRQADAGGRSTPVTNQSTSTESTQEN